MPPRRVVLEFDAADRFVLYATLTALAEEEDRGRSWWQRLRDVSSRPRFSETRHARWQLAAVPVRVYVHPWTWTPWAAALRRLGRTADADRIDALMTSGEWVIPAPNEASPPDEACDLHVVRVDRISDR